MNEKKRPAGVRVAEPSAGDFPTRRGRADWQPSLPAVFDWLGFDCDRRDPRILVDLFSSGASEVPPLSPVIRAAGWKGRSRPARSVRLLDSMGDSIGVVAFPTTSTREIPAKGDYPDPVFIAPNSGEEDSAEFGILTSDPGEGGKHGEVVLRGEVDGDVLDLAWRDSNVLCLGFPLLELLASELNFEPLQDGFYERTNDTNPDAVRRWLIRQVNSLGLDEAWRLDRGYAWPAGKTAGLTIRLDHDRAVESSSIDELIRFCDEHGAKLSSGFLIRKPDADAARRILDAGHELLLHTEAGTLEEFDAEVKAFERMFGVRPDGYTAHGGRGSRGWLGQVQWRWAIECGMSYGEMLGRRNRIPHRAVIRDKRGSAHDSTLLLPGVHLSLDAGMKPEAHNLDRVREEADHAMDMGEHVVLMNHPDIHRSQLYEMIEHCAARAVWHCTFADLAKRHPSRHDPDSNTSTVLPIMSNDGVRDMSMDQMIFVTGFARGGTSWLRDCVAFHPDVTAIPREMPIFKNLSSDTAGVINEVTAAIESLPKSPKYVNKAPANAPFIGQACRAMPESRFVYIVRDPRDAFISHKRSTREWTEGRNSKVDGCLGKLEKYWNGRLDAGDAENLLVVRYEDLHQDFSATMRRIYQHCGLSFDEELIDACWQENNFWATGSRNKEDRHAAARKGVVGDWIEHLEDEEAEWIRKSEYWMSMMSDIGYNWAPPTYRSIYAAIRSCDPNHLSVDDLLNTRLADDRLNVVMLRDIDYLNDVRGDWVEQSAQLDDEFGVHSIYNVLPLDDLRYAKWSTDQVAKFARELAEHHPSVELGMHANPVERHYDKDAPDMGENDQDAMPVILDTLREQIAAFTQAGLKPEFATAHGYGRRRLRPNNRDSPFVADELSRNGIELWDTNIRPKLKSVASHVMQISDVGGAMGVYDAPSGRDLDDPELYRALPPGSLLIMLQHPGNYDPSRRLQLGQRTVAEVVRQA